MNTQTLQDRMRSASNQDVGSARNADSYVTFKKRRRPVNWPLFWAWVKLIAWLIVTKLALAVVYVSMIREALATLIPALAQKVSRAVPGLSFLADFEETRKIDLAFFMAIFLLLAVVVLWHWVLATYLYGHRKKQTSLPVYYRRRELVYVGLAGVIITVDSLLFYYSMIQSGWGETSFSWSALLATVGYLVVLLFLTLATIQIGEGVREAKLNY